ncbi:MAG: pentapeptide repeat-containing protein [Potamolinea sp.]
MNSSSPLNFTNQDLRNRSFKGQNLIGADFSGCDIRGCNFSYALLQGANFERTKAGQTPRQFIPLVVVTIIVA